MFRTLKALFEDGIARFAERDDPADALPLAVAVLLIEIAKADQQHDAAESAAIVRAVAAVAVSPPYLFLAVATASPGRKGCG